RVRLAGDLGADVISADGRLGGEPEPAVERAEVAGCRASAAEQRVGRVVDLDLYRQGRRHLVAGAPLPPDDPLEVDHLPGTVDRAVRVEVGAVVAALLAIDGVEAGEGDRIARGGDESRLAAVGGALVFGRGAFVPARLVVLRGVSLIRRCGDFRLRALREPDAEE